MQERSAYKAWGAMTSLMDPDNERDPPDLCVRNNGFKEIKQSLPYNSFSGLFLFI